MDEQDDWAEILPATRAAAFHKGKSTYARIQLPLRYKQTTVGELQVAIRREAGPDAVVSAVWLLKKDNPKDQRKRVLIGTGDEYPAHLWRETAPELAEILREDPRLEVSITESPGIYASPLMDQYDATVLHFKDYEKRMPLDDVVWSGLQNFVDAGKGLVVVHFACGAFQEWPGFVDVAGRVWNPDFRGHDPYQPFQVSITDGWHPITQGMKHFDTDDELYTCLDGDTPIQVLCESTSSEDKKVYPMGFVVTESKGRVFHSPLGHDVNAFQATGTRQLYRQATVWAAGLE